MLALVTTLATLLPQGPGSSTAPVVINEFSYDDSSTDDVEFLELYNRSGAVVDISGWTIASDDGTNGVPNTPFTVQPATILAPGGYWVMGSALVPNVNQVVGTTNIWENGPDTVVLRDLTGRDIDSLSYEMTTWALAVPLPTYLEGGGLRGDYALTDTSSNPASLQRRVDGFDNDDNGCDFMWVTWTPGTANGSANTLTLGYQEFFDGPAGTSLAADFSYSFVPATVQDPAAVTNATASVIALPISPQLGNIGTFHDSTGGGNINSPNIQVGSDYLVECYVFVRGGNAAIAANEGEVWGVGVRGHTDYFANPPDVPGTYYSQVQCTNQSAGATGIVWLGYVRNTQTEVYLVDMNNGGSGFTVLGGPIMATPGANDGWQRLRIRVQGTNVVGNFGGNYGCDDGTRFTGTATECSGTVFLQYRECIVTNANMTPLCVDRLEVYGVTGSAVTFGGTASPTTVATPAIGSAGGSPVIGNAAFQVTGSSMVPGGVGGLLIGLGNLHAGLPIPGGPATALVYVSPIFVTILLLPDANGDANYGLGIPCFPAIVGLPLSTQIIDIDLALPFAVPVGVTQGMQLLVGN